MDTPTKPSIELTYPLDELPEPGGLVRVAPGVFWLRMPLPIALNHINLWLLEDDDGWTIVDTGIGTDETKELWEQLFEKHLNNKPVKRLIVTHMHPDHIGLAGWLVDKWDVDLWMTRSEYLMCRNLVADNGKEAPEEGLRFYRAAGFDEDFLNIYRSRFGWYGARISPLPNAIHRMVDGQEISIGDHKWTVIVGNGHSPEHACLYCSDLNVLVSGDQILPRISSNVSVRPTEPNENPLADWLNSCRMLIRRLPADALILPSHGRPFYGAHERLRQLIEEHEENLEKLYALCAEPKRAVDTFPALFKGEIGENNLIIAIGESLAHLHYLLAEGRIAVESNEDGANMYYSI
ncbi:MAG: MBL fold metallo-hydrolase [Rhodospirillaceae bacterium]|jgi:glyoxylase-like metal-dependent hydrolase (beta-lactamase superfamily II)|nr:MBL fold metallo-hydrolase [Rhodospirillaceae bacterium]MBT5239296.1 MBL fold metallo-hydrolase [Rhodospirillaceae bacterium]MBT5566314.1 MBL fold metallo-hydrolase [Rhodospirillaceae bacterium]MBT6088407.1 MBL fold metallo-hydrolase [Rhodospirillaceae bacterium]MBT6962296.1 MBL fold metallo-hydrolase [Rhodospirillaceae bacterium]